VIAIEAAMTTGIDSAIGDVDITGPVTTQRPGTTDLNEAD